MRIIAGEHRGRRLLGPATDATRPITDRIKQRIFDRLDAAGQIAHAEVLDVFAGTGSFGLEALSRGASHVHFFERDRSAVKRLRENIAAIDADDRSTIVDADVFAHFATHRLPRPADLVFFDPPYPMVTGDADRLRRLLEVLAPQLSNDGEIHFRHDARDTPDVGNLPVLGLKDYGSMALTYIGRPGGSTP
ncbi:MAG: 16S rRNA (guanine(966)-N(2))-methyltransferase RsmD [Planctomycetota bacterium]